VPSFRFAMALPIARLSVEALGQLVLAMRINERRSRNYVLPIFNNLLAQIHSYLASPRPRVTPALGSPRLAELAQRRAGSDNAVTRWSALDRHFERHAKVVDRFRKAGSDAVLGMWERQTND
jgi:hypothetical protein